MDIIETVRGFRDILPEEALKREKVVKIDVLKCISCGACVEACKYGAITLT